MSERIYTQQEMTDVLRTLTSKFARHLRAFDRVEKDNQEIFNNFEKKIENLEDIIDRMQERSCSDLMT